MTRSRSRAATATRSWAAAGTLVLALAVTLAGVPVREAVAQQRLTNLSHLDFLTDAVIPPPQPGHTTYRLDIEPAIGVLWTYAEPDASGTYARIGGGAYDPDTNTYSQGAYNADDISRAAVVYLRHWQQVGDDHSRAQAYQLLRGLTYLQTAEGPNAGNVVLWMQPDGTLNPSAEPVELPDPSDSGPSYWLARTIWALGEGYAAFRDVDPDFAAFLRERLRLALAAVERQVLRPRGGERQVVDGLAWPAWLIVDGADASSEAVYGLTAYVRASGDRDALRALRQLVRGIAELGRGDPQQWPFGAILPWAQSRSVWHAWGDQMAGALAEASTVRGVGGAGLAAAVREATWFTPHLLIQAGPQNGWLPAPVDGTQIAYGADATLQNLVRVAEATGLRGFREAAGVAAAWYFGSNPAGEAMYDPATGRTFDGVSGDGTVNRNAGAESTIHGLLSMLLLDAHPDVAARAQAATVAERVTWQRVEAETGALSGAAQAVTPDSLWTGESQWSGSGYVELGPGGRVVAEVDLPVADRYHVLPVFWRQPTRRDAVGTHHALAGASAGAVWHGGAGDRGITPEPGFLDMGSSATRSVVGPGVATLTSGYRGDGTPAQLDALLVQPEVEWLVLSGDTGAQALLRSASHRWQTRELTLPGTATVVARAYDRHGRLAREVVGTDGVVAAPVAPGGFTTVTG